MEYLSLIFLHVAFGIIWAGGGAAIGLFVIPAVIEAGPGGGAVMAGVLKRKLPIALTVSGFIVILTGLRLYMVRFSPAWLTAPEGIVLTLGGLLGLGAFVFGFFIQRPIAMRIGALSGRIAASGSAPTAAELQELQTLRERLRRSALITALQLIGAAFLMASHRLATMF